MSKRKGQEPVPEILKRPITWSVLDVQMPLRPPETEGARVFSESRLRRINEQVTTRLLAVAQFYEVAAKPQDVPLELIFRLYADLYSDGFSGSVCERFDIDLRSPDALFTPLIKLCCEKFPDGFRIMPEGSRVGKTRGPKQKWGLRESLDLMLAVDRLRKSGHSVDEAVAVYREQNDDLFGNGHMPAGESLRTKYHNLKTWWEKREWTTAELVEFGGLISPEKFE
jgi:hypothetical protein